ncbi:MAG: hypothetical protein R2784_13330 [Saprospiraceae bacterium]
MDILNNSQHPMAIAYRNFHLFIKNGPDKKYTEALHFAVDTSICYQEQYDSLFKNDLDSLNFIRKGEVVKVLAFLHQQFPDFEVPCWLMEKHPIEFQEAFAPDSFFKNYPYKTANCEGFSEWPEFIVLKAMIRDLQMQKDLHSSTLTLLYQTGKELGIVYRLISKIGNCVILKNWKAGRERKLIPVQSAILSKSHFYNLLEGCGHILLGKGLEKLMQKY